MRWTQFKFVIVAFRVQSGTKKWLFFRARVHTNYKTEEKTKKYSFSCAIRIEKNGAAHEFFDFPSFWLFFRVR